MSGTEPAVAPGRSVRTQKTHVDTKEQVPRGPASHDAKRVPPGKRVPSGKAHANTPAVQPVDYPAAQTATMTRDGAAVVRRTGARSGGAHPAHRAPPQGARRARRPQKPRRVIVVDMGEDTFPPQAQKPHSTITVSEEQVGQVGAFIEEHPPQILQNLARFRAENAVYHVLQDAMIRKYNIEQWMYIAKDSRNNYERFIWTPTVPTAWEKHGYNEPFPVTVALGEGDHAITLELQAQNHKPNQHERGTGLGN